jgi:hypothetical protein
MDESKQSISLSADDYVPDIDYLRRLREAGTIDYRAETLKASVRAGRPICLSSSLRRMSWIACQSMK